MVAYNEKFEPSSFDYLETGLPFKIVISSALLDNVELDEGDEIAVFDGDLCVGATVWEDGVVNTITAWGGSEEHGILGFQKGSPMTFRILQAAIQCDGGC